MVRRRPDHINIFASLLISRYQLGVIHLERSLRQRLTSFDCTLVRDLLKGMRNSCLRLIRRHASRGERMAERKHTFRKACAVRDPGRPFQLPRCACDRPMFVCFRCPRGTAHRNFVSYTRHCFSPRLYLGPGVRAQKGHRPQSDGSRHIPRSVRTEFIHPPDHRTGPLGPPSIPSVHQNRLSARLPCTADAALVGAASRTRSAPVFSTAEPTPEPPVQWFNGWAAANRNAISAASIRWRRMRFARLMAATGEAMLAAALMAGKRLSH